MSEPRPDSATLEQLLAALAERPLSEPEQRRLNSLIRDDRSQLDELAANLEIDAMLQWHFGRVPQPDVRPESPGRDAGIQGGTRSREQSGSRPARRTIVGSAALAVSAMVVLGIGVMLLMPVEPGGTPAPGREVRLTSGWLVQPTGGARYAVVDATHIRLNHGELFVRSAGEGASAALSIETDSATATADGTEFYIGAHLPTGGVSGSPLTRVLVLAGVVTLGNPAGIARGEAGELLSVAGGAAPERIAVRANNAFAWKLQGQLVRERAGGNLFFSPYSVATALAMAEEGARGETALEMDEVLEFPEAARRVGDDPQLIPWRTALLHCGMAQLQERLNAQESEATRELRARIAGLRGELEAANARTVELDERDERDAAVESMREARGLAREINELLTQVDQYQLGVANAIWGDRSFAFDDRYVVTIDQTFGTEGVFSVDFANDHESARGEINAWASEQTGGMVPGLLEEGSVGPQSRLVLTNAVYFLGEWSEPFREGNTQPLAFVLADGERIEVPTMSDLKRGARYGAVNADGSWFATPEHVRPDGADADARYPGDDGFQILELPYKGEELSMVFLLPRGADGLRRLHELLSTGRFDEWIAQTERRNVRVFVPKFEAEGSFLLRDTLRELGMERAFSDEAPPQGADFGGMTAAPDSETGVFIDEVIHKARIRVNERGTEAVAATAVAYDKEEPAAPEALPELVPFTPVFRADRPFAYVIRDRQSGAVLFVGTMWDPRVEG